MNTRHKLGGGGPIPANCGPRAAHAGFACAGLELTANHGENGIANHLGILSRVFLLINFYCWYMVVFRDIIASTLRSASSLLAFFAFWRLLVGPNFFIRKT
jgi:hypothetical protein